MAVQPSFPAAGAEARFEQDSLVYDRYPIAGASVHPSGRVAPGAIAEVDPDNRRLLTVAGEFLYFPYALIEPARAFAERHGLPLVHRAEPWSLILQPFLDTEHSAEQEASALAQLAAWGLEPAEVARLRETVEAPMMAFTALTWEWAFYGLEDYLIVGAAWPAWRSDWPQRYEAAMRIERLGPVVQPWRRPDA